MRIESSLIRNHLSSCDSSVLLQEEPRSSRETNSLNSRWHFNICYVEVNSVTLVGKPRMVPARNDYVVTGSRAPELLLTP